MIEILLATALFVVLVVTLSALVVAARNVLLPREAVTLTINGSIGVAAQTGATLLEALSAAGIAIPAACGGKGSCGLCRVTLPGSREPLLPTEAARLTPAELRAAVRLACQVRVRGEMAVTVDHALLNVQEFDCEVVSAHALTPTIKEIVLAVPAEWEFRFRAGEYVLVTSPPFRLALAEVDMDPLPDPDWARAGLVADSVQSVSRAYSVASRPDDRGLIVLNVRLALPPNGLIDLPPGVVSSWLFGLQAGDRVRTSGPFGDFQVTPGTTELIFVGGGVGMAPLRAMIHDELFRGTDRRMTYFYGARSAADVIYADEFDTLARSHAGFRWVPVISESGRNEPWDGERGFVHEALLRLHLAAHPEPDACQYYLCGPPLMVRAVKAALHDADVDRDRVFHDDFGG